MGTVAVAQLVESLSHKAITNVLDDILPMREMWTEVLNHVTID